MSEWFNYIISGIQWLISFILNLDTHLNEIAASFGRGTYVILFLIVFCETGLVVTPFLPGDSLLFAVGALAAVENAVIDIYLVWILLFTAAVLGDAVNYSIGSFLGTKAFEKEDSRFFKKEYLIKTQKFYERYGGKAIILARFLPIFRTFAPFVAGVAKMNYTKFSFYNVVGAFLWVTTFLWAGYVFGNLDIIKRNFHIVIILIIGISAAPALIEWWQMHRRAKKSTNHPSV